MMVVRGVLVASAAAILAYSVLGAIFINPSYLGRYICMYDESIAPVLYHYIVPLYWSEAFVSMDQTDAA